ncbi:MAG: cyclic pyranopterin monophosphate synthase MoaC [Thermodesulfobacteriota bacterium]|nr:cyclic pyranopterin monophosphate synthase MoaC [Thermodesulfobacteriota bacterium]
MGMVDVTEKPIIRREAEAVGRILVSPDTTRKILNGEIKKGDVPLVAEIAAMNAAKQTHLLIPHCHQILLDTVNLKFDVLDDSVRVSCFVRAQARTGVEMEAIVGVSAALNTIWDMVKYLEKDEKGQYPHTEIADIRVVRKKKSE